MLSVSLPIGALLFAFAVAASPILLADELDVPNFVNESLSEPFVPNVLNFAQPLQRTGSMGFSQC